MQEDKICPFPGLRPFNEEESIFFRGREEHIERIISQLEEKKFVMLTGASGDGKSSLVYAGVIPNARAGFFKAKFNNWLIADFRPERTPFANLATALAEKLNIEFKEVEKELNFGFSSLINLYKKSAFHLEYNAASYVTAEDTVKKKLKRKASNLFILVDQFEEFFTNPENYKDGQVSNESQLVINLLLETARIALVEELPIYIVCTMRSDYIGQCAAFRGLPEFIGFSQFFVPRLKRKEIHQVISEPALLSGNSISSRLVETLINEIGDGFDQLPVLQHTLNRIWHKTEKGKFEMDLLHLAMVGGLPPDQLPESDKLIYQNWFEKVASSKKLFFNKASLVTVLNAHAYELFETAHEYYNATHADKIEKAEAQRIIKTAFQCLTKIDESRAVRNRMSLLEITEIINDPEISVEKVDGVLELFRLQGNTFLKPFALGTENEVLQLEAETVLDITHESLIRNWDILQKWADEEHENWLTFQDFSKQLKRWLTNGKAAGFLLPIGALSFFENWYNQCQPNKYWLARYDEGTSSLKDKQLDAEKTLLDANEFIKASARRLFFSRTVLKYGATKIIAVFGFIMLLIACTYYYFDFKKKQNANVIQRIMAKGELLLNSPDVDATIKADFLINYYRLTSNSSIVAQESYEDLLNKLNNDSMAFEIGYSMLNQCKTITSNDSLPYDNKDVLSNQVFTYLFHRFENETNRQLMNLVEKKTVTVNLKRVNQFLGICALMKNSCSPKDSTEIAAICNKSIGLTKKLLLNSLQKTDKKELAKLDQIEFNNCISILLAIDDSPNYTDFISYFENGYKNENSTINSIYSANLKYTLSCIPLQSGENEILAMLYSTEYDKDTSVFHKIIDLANQNRFNDPDYTPLNCYLLLIRHSKKSISKFNALYNMHSENNNRLVSPIIDFIADITLRSSNILQKENYFSEHNKNYSYYFIDYNRKEDLWNFYLNTITKDTYSFNSLEKALSIDCAKQSDSIKIEIANYFKQRAFYFSSINDKVNSHLCFKKMLELYELVNQKYLNSFSITGNLNGSNDVQNYTYLLYPTICLLNSTFNKECKGIGNFGFYSDYIYQFSGSNEFVKYLKQNGSIEINENLEKSCLYYLEKNNNNKWKEYSDLILKFETNKKYISITKLFNQTTWTAKAINLNQTILCPIIQILNLFERGDSLAALKLYNQHKIDINEKINDNSIIEKLKSELAIQLALYGYNNKAIEVINSVASEKIDLLIYICYVLQSEGAIEDTFVYLDQLFDLLKVDVDKLSNMKLYRTLGRIGGKEINRLAQMQLRKTTEIMKPQALQNLIQGVAERGSYYEALQYMPEYISESTELGLYNELLKAEILKNENKNYKNCFKGNWNDAAFYKLQQ